MPQTLLFAVALTLLTLLTLARGSTAQQRFPSDLFWPLCGQLWTTNSSATYCPPDRWNLTTDRISDGYTPRQKESTVNSRCDFHRGVDLPAPIGSPIFAIADGYLYRVKEAFIGGVSDGISVYIRHNRAAGKACVKSAGGSWYSAYMHLSATVFNKSCDNEAACNVTIVKGQKIGSVGVSVAEFPHVHFEIRDPPSYDNCSANWQADAVNPFRILPYNRSDAAHATRLNITAVAGTGIGSDAPRVMLFINTTRYDWNKVLLVMRDGAGAVVGTYQTPNETSYASYNAKPNWYDIELWNRQWTHRDSSAASWSSFGCGGGNACPYCDQHGAAYDPNTHLDAQCPDSPSACCFNGVRMEPYIFNNRTTGLSYNVTFNLTKNSTDAAACVEAYLLAKSPLTGEYDGSIIGAASWGLCVDTVTPDGEEEAKLAARRRLLMAAGGSGGSSSVRGGASTVGGGRQGVLAGAVAAGAGGMARGGRNQQRRLQAVGAGEVLSRARRALRSTQQP